MTTATITDYLKANQRFRPLEILSPENCALVEITDDTSDGPDLYHLTIDVAGRAEIEPYQWSAPHGLPEHLK